jgi:hypothetical protein
VVSGERVKEMRFAVVVRELGKGGTGGITSDGMRNSFSLYDDARLLARG